MDRGEYKNEELASQIKRIKEEVDGLQVTLTKQSTPWYKNISTIISIMALLFSFGTTYVSYHRLNIQDIQNRRSDLRSILQRLAALPKDNFELSKRYADDLASANFLAGYINQENTLLSRQAAEITDKLPINKVSATEYYAIGLALQFSYNNDGAIEFFKKAIDSSQDFNDEIAALRSYANILFIKGQPETGRVEYQKALNVFSRYEGYNAYTQKSTHIWTELSWATAEANSGFVNLAHQHIASAESLLTSLTPGPGTEQIKRQILQTKSLLPLANDFSPSFKSFG